MDGAQCISTRCDILRLPESINPGLTTQTTNPREELCSLVSSMTKRYKSLLTLQRRMSVYTNPGIAAVVQDQQLERLNFATGLRKDPAGYSQFQQQNISAILTDITNRKQNAFQKAQIDLGRYMDMHHNVNFYQVRSTDVDNLTDVIMTNNNAIENAIQRDKVNSKRQFEINEWYNYNKLETLFYLQVVFMSVLTATIITYWAKNGLITPGFAGVLYGALGLIIVSVGLYKYFYTELSRDTKLWHRRRFAQASPPPPAPPSCPDVSGSWQDQVNDAMNSAMDGALSAGNCVSNMSTNVQTGLANANTAATQEMLDVQSGKTNVLKQLQKQMNSAARQVCSVGGS